MSTEQSGNLVGGSVERREYCHRLNEWFRKKHTIWEPEVLREIRKSEFPIIVDFNNVLVNNQLPLTINPAAKKLLQALEEIGDVFVVTTATSWENVSEYLKKIDAQILDWAVLIVRGNYYSDSNSSMIRLSDSPFSSVLADYLAFIDQENLHQQAGISTREEVAKEWHIEDPEELKEFRKQGLVGAPANKGVAPFFMKRWNIPIIDDYLLVGPGLEHLRTYPWPLDEYPRIKEGQEGFYSFDEAVARVKQIKETVLKTG